MTVRVLFCAGSLHGGGSERQLWQLATHLPPSGFQSQFFLLQREGIYLTRMPPEIQVHSWQPPKLASSWLPGSIHLSQINQLTALLGREKIDLVYDRGFHSTLLTAPACRRSGVRRISVIVSPPSKDFGGSRERFRSWKYRILKKAYTDPSALTVAVSSSVADDASRYFDIPVNSIVVFPNSVDCQSIRQLSERKIALENRCDDLPLQRNETSTSKNFTVALIGRMTPEKGHATLLKAAALWQESISKATNQNLTIQMVGDGPLQPELRGLSQHLGIEDRVHWLGFQKNPYPSMAQADLICIPSHYEGFPNVALEAMALGKPLVVSPIEVLVQLIGENNDRGLVLPSCSPEMLAKAINQFMVQPEPAEQRATIAKRWVVEQYDFPRWLLKAQELIISCLETKTLSENQQRIEHK